MVSINYGLKISNGDSRFQYRTRGHIHIIFITICYHYSNYYLLLFISHSAQFTNLILSQIYMYREKHMVARL